MNAGQQRTKRMEMTMQNNCSGNKPHTDGAVKLMPTGGGGNMILCAGCWSAELQWRRNRNRTLGEEAFALPDWTSAKEYDTGEGEKEEVKDFQTALAGFLVAAQAKVNERMKQYAPMQAVRLDTQEGQKYVRVVAIDTVNGQEAENGSAYCFIDKENGNVLKPAGWKSPEKKNPRSNIYAQDFGASGVTGYGTVYLRR